MKTELANLTYSLEAGRPDKRLGLKRFWIVSANAAGHRTIVASFASAPEAEAHFRKCLRFFHISLASYYAEPVTTVEEASQCA